MENYENDRLDDTPVTEEIDDQTENELLELKERISRLEDELSSEKIKVALLLAGVTAEKLDEGAVLTAGLLNSGKSLEDAVSEIIDAYPHLRAVKREIPQFASGSSGQSDGFSAIRRVFSGK